MLRIIVTFAVRAEFAPWRRLRRFKRLRESGASIYSTQSGEGEIYVVLTGIGTRGARTELHKLLARPTDICVVSGLAGSLKSQHAAGTILVARAIKRDKTETVITSDRSLVKIATQCGATAVDFFCTADAILNSPPEKLRLGQTADAVEMESFQIMTEAQRNGVRAVALRAVSDPVDRNLPLDFNRVIDEDGEIGWLRALSQVAAAPTRLPQLIRFGFESSRAARKLGHFLDEYVKCLTTEPTLQLNAARTEVR
ncbi:MAG TPA: hypothetical protein VE422_46730 [Terriglobia bacterium]|nr:hypothetical protein [Terriglobia bacterium]